MFLRFLNFDVWREGRLSGRPFCSRRIPRVRFLSKQSYICYSMVHLCPKIVDIKFFVTRARPLTAPLLRLLSGWVSRRLSPQRRLPSTCASASHRTVASHRAPLTPFVWLVVASLLVTPPPPVHLRLHLSLHYNLRN
jgi:hypothetical protein